MQASQSMVLSSTIEAFLISAYPHGTCVTSIPTDHPGYRIYPMRISVRKPDGTSENCVLKTRERIEVLEREAQVLGALAEIGLPVPTVLANPESMTDQSGTYAAIVLSELPGQPLPWLGTTSLAHADLTCRLVIQAVNELHKCTEHMSRHSVATILPHSTLSAELQTIVDLGGEWFNVELFVRAVAYLRRGLDNIQVPLVFSNGDYNPLNFLHEGPTLTGYVDFEHACFEDPHAGFAKFMTLSVDAFGWGTGMKAGLVERYLYSQGVSRREFIPRLILRCIRRLQRDVSVTGDADAVPRQYMLHILQESLAEAEQF